MYNELLSIDWNDMMMSDYIFKSNTEKHVIQVYGSEFNKNDKSLILVYYNVYTNKPMMLLQRYNDVGLNLKLPDIDGYSKTLVEGEDDEGVFTEVTYVLKSLQEALED